MNVHLALAFYPALSSTKTVCLRSQWTSPLGRHAESRYSLFGLDHTGQYHTHYLTSLLSVTVFAI